MPSYLEMPLTDHQKTQLEKYWKEGPHREASRRNMQAECYIRTFLTAVRKETGYARMCLNSGTDFYQRNDGADIGPDDMEAVRNHWLGQENTVTQEDAKTIRRYWLCDSSD